MGIFCNGSLIVLTNEISPFRSRDINTDARYDNDALFCISARNVSCPESVTVKGHTILHDQYHPYAC